MVEQGLGRLNQRSDRCMPKCRIVELGRRQTPRTTHTPKRCELRAVFPAQEQRIVRRGIHLVGGFVFTAGNVSQFNPKQIFEPYGRQHVVDADGAGLHLLLGRIGANVNTHVCLPINWRVAGSMSFFSSVWQCSRLNESPKPQGSE